MKHISLFSILLSLLFSLPAASQNPYLPLGECIPDGEPYVFEDPDHPGSQRVYVYGSHDSMVSGYCGREQVVWSASVDDLLHWRYDGVIFESKTDAKGNLLHKDGSGDVIYAPDVVERTLPGGKHVYYLYPNNQEGGRNTMVCRSDRPDGPFTAINWDKENPQATTGMFGFDPAAFIDSDGRAYGYWGFGHSCAAELDTATMSSVKPGTEIVKDMVGGFENDHMFRFYEASSIRKVKDKYIFIYSRTTNDGEQGLPASNYTLAYAYSMHPLGPWTYGGTIIDGRALERRPDGTFTYTATPNGNTHGSICQIKGRWYVFYHRQAGTDEYSRQAMVAPIDVEVIEGEDGYVKISQAEYTSEGFATDGLNPYTTTPAGLACYYTGPQGARHVWPKVEYSGSHTQVVRQNYKGVANPYDLSLNSCPMVNNTAGSVVGYKYFNLAHTYGQKHLRFALTYEPEGTAGRIDIMLDRPTEGEGGVKIGQIDIPAASGTVRTVTTDIDALKHFNGKHALYFVFSSATKNKSLCKLHSFAVTR